MLLVRDITAHLLAAGAAHESPRSGGAAHAPAAEDLRSAWLARSASESLQVVEASVAASRLEVMRQEFLNPVTVSATTHKRLQLGRRAFRRETGLSNPAYLAASTGTQFFRVEVESARVKFTFSDPVAESVSPSGKIGGLRGNIRELSEASRQRLANRAWALTAEGYTPEVMVTLTAPANWEALYVATEDGEVIEGGRVLKRQMEAFRKRLGRFLAAGGVAKWSALWFIEFQQRGAPHIHLMLFGCSVSAELRKAMRGWCGRAWSSIVGNPEARELAKHRRAGTQVARMRAPHFGYAVKYATKTEQKDVPHEFRDVGRFWGTWNYSSPDPVVVHIDYSRLNADEVSWVQRVVFGALATVAGVSADFAATRAAKVMQTHGDGLKHKFGFTVFGAPAGLAALSALGPA